MGPYHRSSRMQKNEVNGPFWPSMERDSPVRAQDRGDSMAAPEPSKPLATCSPGSCRLRREISQPDQVVDRQPEDEHPPDSRPAAVPCLAQQADRFQPPENLLNAFALLLTDVVAGVPR